MYELSLEAHYRTISVEANAGEASLQQAITRLPMFFKAAKTRLSEALAYPISAMFPAKNLEWAAHELATIPYQILRTKTFPSVPGVKVDYLAYTEQLAADAKLVDAIEKEYLDPFITYLSGRLNSPDGLRSMKPDTSLNHINLSELNKHAGMMGRLINVKDDAPTKPYDKLIRRQGDWADIVKHSQAINLTFTKSDHDRFTAKADRLNALLGTLIQRLTAEHDAYKVSGPVLKNIIDASYACATAVEFYGLTYRRALVLDQALTQLVDQVKRGI
jgi:hypothetical protein